MLNENMKTCLLARPSPSVKHLCQTGAHLSTKEWFVCELGAWTATQGMGAEAEILA